jgi:serine/threonine-protein kinase HipA
MTTPASDDLEALRTVERADVYKAGRLAAALTRTADGVEFRYLDDWLAANGPPIASTLPTGSALRTRPGGALPAYFAGLLPEGRRLGALRRSVKTSADDELSLLLAVGADTIGDVQVVPEGVEPTEVPPQIVVDNIGELSFADLLTQLGITPQRAGIPGVQDKTSAVVINLPVARAGERYLLKLNPMDEYPNLVDNEAFFLAAARKSGLSVPPAVLVTDVEGLHGLLVQRFDRITVDGQLGALAVEDGCQAADRPPADKYLLGADRTTATLASLCDAPLVAGRELLRQLAFAYLTCNGDAHAKNFSVLQDPTGEWKVSPAYDVPCSYVYGDHTMALSIGGRIGGDFGFKDFAALGASLNVPERAVRGAVTELVERADLWLPDIDQLPFDAGLLAKLKRVIKHRRMRLNPG